MDPEMEIRLLQDRVQSLEQQLADLSQKFTEWQWRDWTGPTGPPGEPGRDGLDCRCPPPEPEPEFVTTDPTLRRLEPQ